MATATEAPKFVKPAAKPRKAVKPAAPAIPPAADAPRDGASLMHAKVKEILALTFAFATLMGMLSLWTYHPIDIPGEAFHLEPGGGIQPRNACGWIGAWFAYFMLTYIGFTSYLVMLLGFGWSCALFLRHELRDMSLKITGMLFLITAGSSLLSILFPGGLMIPSGGGLFGIAFAHVLQTYLNTAGTLIVLGLISMLSMILATDWMFYDVAKHGWALFRDRRLSSAEKTPFLDDADAATALDDDAMSRPDEVWTFPERGRAAKTDSEETEALAHAVVVEDEEEAEAAPATRQRAARQSEADAEEAASDEEPAEEPVIEEPTAAEIKRMERERKKAEMEAMKDSERKRKELQKAIAEAVKAEGSYELPNQELLAPVVSYDHSKEESQLTAKAMVIKNTLRSFGIDVNVVHVERGPVITQFELELPAGVKVNRVLGLQDNLAMDLKATKLRVIAPIPGKSTVGIEIPNASQETVRLKELLEICKDKMGQYELPILLGKDVSGTPLYDDMSKMPHMLIAGTTGSGKSVCINAIILSLLITKKPSEVKMIMVDPKMVEMGIYKDIPHLMHPVITDPKKAAAILDWIVEKMEDRYALLNRVGTKNIANFNRMKPDGIKDALQKWCAEHGEEFIEEDCVTHLPYIVVIIDELADLMMVSKKEVESSIVRLAQKSRAVGIHLVLATQRPSVDVITGLIKANMPSRIAFHVMSKVDSRTILDSSGAEKLIGKGDMLFMPPGTSKLVRAQSAFVDEDEIKEIVTFIKAQAKPVYEEPQLAGAGGKDKDFAAEDDLYDQAVDFIVETQRGSVSLLQRRLGIGYTRASRLIDMMAEAGIVGAYKGAQAREVMIKPEQWAVMKGKPAE